MGRQARNSARRVGGEAGGFVPCWRVLFRRNCGGRAGTARRRAYRRHPPRSAPAARTSVASAPVPRSARGVGFAGSRPGLRVALGPRPPGPPGDEALSRGPGDAPMASAADRYEGTAGAIGHARRSAAEGSGGDSDNERNQPPPIRESSGDRLQQHVLRANTVHLGLPPGTDERACGVINHPVASWSPTTVPVESARCRFARSRGQVQVGQFVEKSSGVGETMYLLSAG